MGNRIVWRLGASVATSRKFFGLKRIGSLDRPWANTMEGIGEALC
jgi:hypothetical protein